MGPAVDGRRRLPFVVEAGGDHQLDAGLEPPPASEHLSARMFAGLGDRPDEVSRSESRVGAPGRRMSGGDE